MGGSGVKKPPETLNKAHSSGELDAAAFLSKPFLSKTDKKGISNWTKSHIINILRDRNRWSMYIQYNNLCQSNFGNEGGGGKLIPQVFLIFCMYESNILN